MKFFQDLTRWESVENINRGKTGWQAYGLKLTWSSHKLTHTAGKRRVVSRHRPTNSMQCKHPCRGRGIFGLENIVSKRIECSLFLLFHTDCTDKVLVLHHMTIVQNYARQQQIKIAWQVTVTFSSDPKCPSAHVMKGETGCRGRLKQLIQTVVDNYQHQRILWDIYVSSSATGELAVESKTSASW